MSIPMRSGGNVFEIKGTIKQSEHRGNVTITSQDIEIEFIDEAPQWVSHSSIQLWLGS